MAAREYRPYPTRKEQKNRTIRIAALSLIVLILVVVIVIRTYNVPEPQPSENPTEQKVPLNSILPVKPANAGAASQPERVLNPAVSAKPSPSPVPAAAPVESAIPAAAPAVKPDPSVTTVQAAQDTLTAADTDTGQTSEKAKELIKQATDLRDTGKIIPARDLLNDTLNMSLSPSIRSAVKLELSKLAQKWLFSPQVFAEDKLTGYVLVQPGDLLQEIAKAHKVPYEILMEINGIARPELLQAGKKIKVIEGPFNVVIYKKSFTMDLYLQNKYIKTYQVGLDRKSVV